MYGSSRYVGSKGVPIDLLWGLSVYYITTWTVRGILLADTGLKSIASSTFVKLTKPTFYNAS